MIINEISDITTNLNPHLLPNISFVSINIDSDNKPKSVKNNHPLIFTICDTIYSCKILLKKNNARAEPNVSNTIHSVRLNLVFSSIANATNSAMMKSMNT